ncbi:hypothetical protein [Bacillus safensis]|uniref:hypothetical protein n=1 Tax=Bacillus safensis TaxID=561879 RepID=UPI002DC05638|nr:hypothetical protein [Bacillus safensis]MEC0923948.1 hypothetical protein [Bacillus safensis]MEC0996957.1 hypothetical protein [Bacillus safensis]
MDNEMTKEQLQTELKATQLKVISLSELLNEANNKFAEVRATYTMLSDEHKKLKEALLNQQGNDTTANAE